MTATLTTSLWATAITRPFDGSLQLFALQYVVFIAIGLVAHTTFHAAHRRYVAPIPSIFETVSYRFVFLTAVFIAPVVEELLFRGLPLWALSGPWQYIALGGATVVWGLLHGRRGAVFALTGGLIFVKLWVDGYGVYAIWLHALHNLCAATVLIGWDWATRRRTQNSGRQTTPDIDRL